jgi:hypothetical protein
MLFQEVSAEQLAELFHHYHQTLAPDHGASQPISSEWKELSQKEKSRMVAAVRLTLLELDSVRDRKQDSRRYFAAPGEAEWGC